MTTRNESKLPSWLSAAMLGLLLVLVGFATERSYHAVGRAGEAEEAACQVSRTLGEHMARQEEREKAMMSTLVRIESNVKALRNGHE